MFQKSLEKFVRQTFNPLPLLVHSLTSSLPSRLQKVPVKITALVNDTTGTLIASAYVDKRTKLGIIFGTGCNCAYMEKMSGIGKLKALGLPDDDEVGFWDSCGWRLPSWLTCDSLRTNRWPSTANGAFRSTLFFFRRNQRTKPPFSILIRGAFDSSTHEHLPRTSYDIIIDETSNKPGQQAFEKMIAGLYLGEIFRLIMCEMIDEGSFCLPLSSSPILVFVS